MVGTEYSQVRGAANKIAIIHNFTVHAATTAIIAAEVQLKCRWINIPILNCDNHFLCYYYAH